MRPSLVGGLPRRSRAGSGCRCASSRWAPAPGSCCAGTVTATSAARRVLGSRRGSDVRSTRGRGRRRRSTSTSGRGQPGRVRHQPDRRRPTPRASVALAGFLWPDQVERRARLDAAIEIARPASRRRSIRADAGDWVAEQLAEPVARRRHRRLPLDRAAVPAPGELRPDARGHRTGRRAEPPPTRRCAGCAWSRPARSPTYGCGRWPGGTEDVLATTGYHGPPVTWRVDRPADQAATRRARRCVERCGPRGERRQGEPSPEGAAGRRRRRASSGWQ